MKKYFLIFIFALIFIPNLFNPFSFAGNESSLNDFGAQILYNNSDEIITNFSSEIIVNKDNSIDVIEKITYDFKDLQKHGMYRFIPLNKPAGAVRNLKITDISVTDEKGIPYNFEQTGTNEVNIKIGDADKLITGQHIYIIKYKILNPIGYFDNYDEIYWNATGNEWQVPIFDSISSVYLPGDLTKSKLQIASYCDYKGQNKPCINAEPVYDANTNQTIVIFSTPKDFYYALGYGMSVAVGFSKGIVAPAVLKWYEKPISYVYIAYGVVFIFVLLFIHLIFIKFLPEYNKRKRPIITEFEPPQDILPSQAGVIYNLFGLGNSRILTADILYLASLGYIKIENIPVDSSKKKSFKIAPEIIILIPFIPFILIMSMVMSAVLSLNFYIVFITLFILFLIINKNKVKNLINSIKNPTEFSISRLLNKDISLVSVKLKLLYNLISKQDQTVTLSDIEEEKNYNSFQNYINNIKESIKKTIEPKKSKGVLRVIIRFFVFIFCIGLFFAFIFGLVFVQETIGIDAFPIQALIPMYILVGGFILYKITKYILTWRLSKMTDSWYAVAGLHRYIKIAEKSRIQFESDPTKAEQIFSTLLPYAVAFGLEDKWIHVFDGIMVNPPDWYGGSNLHTMSSSIGLFAGAISLTSNAGAPVSSSSSSFGGSSGGGFSGGGGGGGGGGSW